MYDVHGVYRVCCVNGVYCFTTKEGVEWGEGVGVGYLYHRLHLRRFSVPV